MELAPLLAANRPPLEVLASLPSITGDLGAVQGYAAEQFVRYWLEQTGAFTQIALPARRNGYTAEYHRRSCVLVKNSRGRVVIEYDGVLRHKEELVLIEVKSGAPGDIKARTARGFEIAHTVFGEELMRYIFFTTGTGVYGANLEFVTKTPQVEYVPLGYGTKALRAQLRAA